jgi:hypothetical protein
MKYGLGHLSVVPCRAEASDSSEQVTQLLFGETVKVYEKKRSWYRVKTAYDNYECWMDENQFVFISEEDFKELQHNPPKIVNEFADILKHEQSGEMMSVLLGSTLPFLNDKKVRLGNEQWIYEGGNISLSEKAPKSKLVEHALMLLNAPYQWGGRSPFGIDCSGFVQLVYKLNGIILPRDASQQAEKGNKLSFIEEAEEGDLAFFDNEEGKITHVGMILDNNRIIHASGMVRIDRLDHQGIFNQEKRDYTHRLRLISKIC